MMKRRCLLAIAVLLAPPARADEGPCPSCGTSHDANRTAPRTPRDAGYPRCISHFAIFRDREPRIGYYVGGGSACGGHERCLTEGTWGWDYAGLGGLLPKSRLRWNRFDRYQGGGGSYATDRK